MSEKITVNNHSGVRLYACINQWGDSGKTGWFKFDKRETWSRTDSRGFVLGVSKSASGSNPSMYYVKAGGTVNIEDANPFELSFPDGSSQYMGRLNT